MSTFPKLRIVSIEPKTIVQNEPFKANWTVELGPGADIDPISISFLTDDARLLLCDHQSDETPVLLSLNAGPTGRISKTTVLHVRMRKGLHNEHSRDGTPAPLTLHARLQTDEDQNIAISQGYKVWVDNLAKRPETKIFL